jgi:hypothetical protein
LQLDIVVIFCPVVTDKQHTTSPSRNLSAAWRRTPAA